MHRMLHKALLGQPVTISVLGGSSACHLLGSIITAFSIVLSIVLALLMLTMSCIQSLPVTVLAMTHYPLSATLRFSSSGG